MPEQKSKKIPKLFQTILKQKEYQKQVETKLALETKLKKKQSQIAKLKDLGLEEREFEALDSGAL